MGPDTTKVFIVDDDDAVRDSLQVLLESYGIYVESYASPRDFLRHYRPAVRECLILDQHLPGATGLDFLASPEGIALDLPVIMLTGRGDASIRDCAYALGAAAYFEKPVGADILLKAIANAVDGGDLGRLPL